MLERVMQKLRRRPFPMNLHALRSCRVSYSQFGEDLFLTTLLGYEKTDGVFIDIGCFHPIDFSNTYIFSQRGWRGLAIDPNPAFTGAWARYRPNDAFVNAAVSKAPGQALYLMNRRYPAMNKLIDALPTNGLSADESTTTVPLCTLAELVSRHLPGQSIDLLNVDCEGHDLIVLQSIDFNRIRPHVIAAEEWDGEHASPVVELLQAQGYALRARIGITLVFEDLARHAPGSAP